MSSCCYVASSSSAWLNITASTYSFRATSPLSVSIGSQFSTSDCTLSAESGVFSDWLCGSWSPSFFSLLNNSSSALSFLRVVSIQNTTCEYSSSSCTLPVPTQAPEPGIDPSLINLGPLGRQPLWLVIVCCVLLALLIFCFIFVIYRRNRGSAESAALIRPNSNVSDSEYITIAKSPLDPAPPTQLNIKPLVDLSNDSSNLRTGAFGSQKSKSSQSRTSTTMDRQKSSATLDRPSRSNLSRPSTPSSRPSTLDRPPRSEAKKTPDQSSRQSTLDRRVDPKKNNLTPDTITRDRSRHSTSDKTRQSHLKNNIAHSNVSDDDDDAPLAAIARSLDRRNRTPIPTNTTSITGLQSPSSSTTSLTSTDDDEPLAKTLDRRKN